MQRLRSLCVAFSLVILAIIPHWKSVFLTELPLPEGYLKLLTPKSNVQTLTATPWNALWWDSIGQFWSWRTEAIHQLSTGRLPLWTNRIGCGFPFLADMQTQTVYPPTILASAFQISYNKTDSLTALLAVRTLKFTALFHSLLAVLGAYLLIRSYGLTRSSSLVGATAFGLSSFQISWVLLPTLPATASWLPMTLFLMRRCRTSISNGDWHWIAWLSLSIAMMLLAGHGQIAIYSLLAVSLFAVIEVFASTDRFRTVFVWSVSFTIAFLLFAPQLFPSMELIPLTHRFAPPTWDGYKSFAQRGLSVLDWATLALPFLFGNPMDGSYFGKESFADYCTYSGFGVTVFAVFGLCNLIGSRLKFTVCVSRFTLQLHATALFILGALLASGSSFNLPFYFLLPGFSQFGTPTRAIFLCQLALGMATATGLDWVNGTIGNVHKPSWITIFSVLIFAIVFSFIASICVGMIVFKESVSFSWVDWMEMLAVSNLGIIAGLIAVTLILLASFAQNQTEVSRSKFLSLRYCAVILLISELIWFSGQQIPTAHYKTVKQILEKAIATLQKDVSKIKRKAQYPLRLLPLGGDWSLIQMPKTFLPPNSVLLLTGEFADVRNYNSLLLKNHKAVMATFSQGKPCPLENGNLILLPRSITDAEKLAWIVGAEAILVRSNNRFEVQPVSLSSSTYETNSSRVFVPRFVTFTSQSNFSKLLDLPKGESFISINHISQHQPRIKVTLLDDEDSKVSISVSKSSSPFTHFSQRLGSVWVVLTDTAYPGWKAFWRDSNKRWHNAKIDVANFSSRACHVPTDARHILWVYFPQSFAVGLFWGFIGLSLIVCILTIWLIGHMKMVVLQ